MSRPKAKTTQEKPTAPRAVDSAGRELDAFGLPFSGPARVRRLVELCLPDPNFEPEAWAAPAPVTETEKSNG